MPITPSTPAVKGVQATLARAVSAAVAPNGPDALYKVLSTGDRKRMEAASVDWADVDRAADAFRSAWQAQFGQSFKVDDKIDVVFTEPTTHVDAATTRAAGGATTQPTRTVRLIGPGGHSAAVLRLVQPASGDWQIELPDSITAATLHDSLLHQLTAVTADHARWPTELGQAYVYTTQRLLSAMGEPIPVPK